MPAFIVTYFTVEKIKKICYIKNEVSNYITNFFDVLGVQK